MVDRWTSAVTAGAFLVGLPVAFFVAFNAVFSDSFTLSQHLFALVYVGASYVALGSLFGALSREAPRTPGLALAAPAVVLVAWYMVREPGGAGFQAAVVAVSVAAAVAGSWIGARTRSRVRA